MKFSLVCAGAMLSLFTFLMIHHISSAIPHWEIAAFIFNLSYFSGASFGYKFSHLIPLKKLSWIIPLTLFGQAVILLFVQPIFFLLNHWRHTLWGLPIGEIGIFLLLLSVGTSIFAVVLPQAIQTHKLSLSKAYSWEVCGSILGLLLLPILAQQKHEFLIAIYSLFFILLSASLKLPAISQIIVGLIAIGWIVIFKPCESRVSTWYYQQKYPSKNVRSLAETRYTPYHKIDMVNIGNDRTMLLLNGQRQFAEGSHHVYSYFVAELPTQWLAHKSNPLLKPDTLVLGCGSMSTVGRIGEMASHIKIVDIDPQVFAMSRKYFQEFNHLDNLHNWDFEADDAKHFLANTSRRYDLILHDIPPARSRQTALTYTQEFFTLVKSRLKPGGLFSIATLSSRSTSNDKLYGKKIMATLASVFDDIVVVLYKDSYYTYSGSHVSDMSRDDLLETTMSYLTETEREEWFKDEAQIWLKEDVLRETRGIAPITVNNTGELIFD